jgi:hypothetical protein
MMFGFVDPDQASRHPDLREDPDHGGPRRRRVCCSGPLVGAAILVPLEEISNNLLGGRGRGSLSWSTALSSLLIARFQPGGILTLIKRVWTSDKAAKKVIAEGAPMLLEARDVTEAFGSFKAVDAASVTLEQGRPSSAIGPNSRQSRPSSIA